MYSERGYAVILGVVGSALLLVLWSQLFFVGQRLNMAHQLRTALDTAAYSGAVIQSRTLNALGLLNRAYIGHQIATAHLITLSSWAHFAQTQARQSGLANPPSWLISSFFGSSYGQAYQGSQRAPNLGGLMRRLEGVFAQQQGFSTELYQQFIENLEAQTKKVRDEVINQVFTLNVGLPPSAYSYQIDFQNDDWLQVFRQFSAPQGVQWVRQLQGHYQFLQKRDKTVRSRTPVSSRCPHLRHQLRRIGKTEIDAQGQWSADDSLSFHALRSNRWIGCYYREYAMGWAWQPMQGVGFDQPYSDSPRDSFGDLHFWRWVEQQSGWGYLSEGVNPLANTYAVRDHQPWVGAAFRALDYSQEQQYGFELQLHLKHKEQNYIALSGAQSVFSLPPRMQWAKTKSQREQGWFPFWTASLAAYHPSAVQAQIKQIQAQAKSLLGQKL